MVVDIVTGGNVGDSVEEESVGFFVGVLVGASVVTTVGERDEKVEEETDVIKAVGAKVTAETIELGCVDEEKSFGAFVPTSGELEDQM